VASRHGNALDSHELLLRDIRRTDRATGVHVAARRLPLSKTGLSVCSQPGLGVSTQNVSTETKRGQNSWEIRGKLFLGSLIRKRPKWDQPRTRESHLKSYLPSASALLRSLTLVEYRTQRVPLKVLSLLSEQPSQNCERRSVTLSRDSNRTSVQARVHNSVADVSFGRKPL
jgi:hypothetical protein